MLFTRVDSTPQEAQELLLEEQISDVHWPLESVFSSPEFCHSDLSSTVNHLS